MAQTECAMFEEDEVCKRIDDKFVYGIITESSEFLSSDEEDDEEDCLRRGTVRVLWHPDGNETVEEENKVTLIDRALMPGDVIRRMISGKSSQRGYVQDLDVTCHLNIKGTNKYIYNVNAKDLMPIRKFDFDDDVTMGAWYGKVEATNMLARVVFPDGAECIVDEENLYDLDSCMEEPDSENILYPGSVLKGERETLQDVKWLHETKANNHKMALSKNISVRIEENMIKSVQVNWICRGFNTPIDLSKSEQPNSVEMDDLHKLLKLGKFQHCSIQINDILMYTIKDTDILSEVPPGSDVGTSINEINSIKSLNVNVNNVTNGNSDPCLTTNTATKDAGNKEEVKTTKVDLEEVDGARCTIKVNTSGVVANGILDDEDEMDESVNNTDVSELVDDQEYEDIPDQTKDKRKRSQKRSAKGKRKKKKIVEFPTNYPECKVGETVPVAVFCTFSVGTVMWQDGSIEKGISSVDLYPIHHLDEQEFFPGDFVVEAKEESEKPGYFGAVVSCDHHGRTCMVNWYKIENGTNIRSTETPEEVSVYDIKDHPDYKFRPGDIVVAIGDPKKSGIGDHAVGQIASLDCQGGLYVRWPDNTTSFCHPQDLFLVGGDMSDFDSDSDSSDFSDDSTDSWETEEEEEEEECGASEDENESKKPARYKAVELENLLDRATAALSKLDDIFSTLPQSIDYAKCFHEIIYIYKKCRDLEKILKSSFFKDQELVELITEAKKQLRKFRTEKYNRRIEELSKQIKAVSNELEGNEKRISAIKKEICYRTKVKENNVNIGDQSKEDSASIGDQSKEDSASIGDQSKEDSASIGDQSKEDSASIGDQSKEKNVSCGNESSKNSEMTEMDQSPGSVASREEEKLVKKLVENDLDRIHDVCDYEADLGRTDETVDAERDRKLSPLPSSGKDNMLNAENTDTNPSGTSVDLESESSGRSVDSDSQQLCLKICKQMQERMKRVLEEVVPDWIAEATLLVDDEMLKKTSAMSVTEEVVSPVTEENQSSMESSVSQEVTSPTSSEDVPEMVDEITANRFVQEGEVPHCHKFYTQPHVPTNLKTFMNAVSKEMRLLQRCLPEGIIVQGYEDRMDLYSAMIIGPKKTPYEDAPFFFDIQLPNDYPKSPPLFHYISFCTDRLNPNLYDDGKVCVSLLGTWEGKDTETWTSNSSLLQVLVSIQGLILVDEPYYNEAGYEKHRGTQQGAENSKMYNEMAILKLVDSLTNMIKNIPESFKSECIQHLMKYGPRMLQRFVYLSANPSPEKSSSEHKQNPIDLQQKITSDNVSLETSKLGEPVKVTSENTSSETSRLEKPVRDHPVIPDATNDNKNSCNSHVSDEQTANQDISISLSSTEHVHADIFKVEFPLFPLSRGFCLTMKKKLSTLKNVLTELINSHSGDV